MRITDNILTNTFLSGLSANKAQMQNLQLQLASNSKINKPSDSPVGAARSLRINTQMSDNKIYSENIANGRSGLEFTTQAMDAIQTEMDKVVTTFANLKNPINSTQMSTYADYIDNSLTSILNSANTEHDGKYIFGGTDNATKTFDYSADKKTIVMQVSDISGEQNVKIAPNITQKINISGAELFGTSISLSGNVSSTETAPQQSTTSVYDARGNAYSFNVSYTKTADNTYDMKYEVLDSAGKSVSTGKNSVKFDPNSGGLNSVDGNSPKNINVNVPGKELSFTFNPTDMKEKAGDSSFSYSANQKTDIFNTLLTVRDNLRAGKMPTDEQIQAVYSFNTHLSQKESEAGNMINSMDNTDELLTNQNTELTTLLSKEKDVDVAQAIMDLQNKDYLLKMSYKVSSMILPKSLVDYL